LSVIHIVPDIDRAPRSNKTQSVDGSESEGLTDDYRSFASWLYL
jgi:hypothetical protein